MVVRLLDSCRMKGHNRMADSNPSGASLPQGEEDQPGVQEVDEATLSCAELSPPETISAGRIRQCVAEAILAELLTT
jgi:hypothetical protein